MASSMAGRKLEHWQKVAILLAVYDAFVVTAAYFLALWFRFDCKLSAIPDYYLGACLKFSPLYAAFCLVVFYFSKLYNSIWRFASYTELMRVLKASALTALFHILGITLLFQRMPISYYVGGPVIQFMLVLGIRFSYRFVLLEKGRSRRPHKAGSASRVMIVGAGSAGQMVLRDALRMKEEVIKVCCIIDDNPNKQGRYIDGVPVVGGRELIPSAAKKFRIDRIWIAIPSASSESKREILNLCQDAGCEVKNLPSVYQMVSGSVGVGDMRDVDVEDLLGRDPIMVNMEEIYGHITGKTILVTGGGGSIGSELCRQVAAHKPRQLIIFDIYENNAYDIQLELKAKYPRLDLQVLIGSVRDSRRISSVFQTYHPDIVYHAAAHKHVPLMEDSPCESIKNNVIGTYKTAYAAMMAGCQRFVLISTDKAVNPTNIMGASKRLCEMVIQYFDHAVKTHTTDAILPLFTHSDEFSGCTADRPQPRTEYVAVRFGNVLSSNGSVIPLFKKQIAKGGPVTVTHPDIIRYFMTIPEAVRLVMQAGVYARGGEIFVLDMGAPVKIDDLARTLIKLSGHKIDEEIPIVYTGLRPGEKLYEEKLMAEEGLQRTENDLIHIGAPIPFDFQVFAKKLRVLMEAAYVNSPEIRDIVADMVPTYHAEMAESEKKDSVYEKLCQESAVL